MIKAKKAICKLEMIKVKLEVKRVDNDIAIELLYALVHHSVRRPETPRRLPGDCFKSLTMFPPVILHSNLNGDND